MQSLSIINYFYFHINCKEWINNYKSIGRYVDFAYANSSWTAGHMSEIWGENVDI